MMIGYKVDVGDTERQVVFQNWVTEFNTEHPSAIIEILSIIPTMTNEVIYVVQSNSRFAWQHLNAFYEDLTDE